MIKTGFAEYRPNIAWYLLEEGEWRNPPENFEQELRPLFQRIYPQEPILVMQDDGYDPVIIGYDHSSSIALLHIGALLADLKSRNPHCKVAMEILSPETYSWITEFLKDETEYKIQGTLWGKKPSASQIEGLTIYRGKLAQNFSQSLLFWLLENKFATITIEHPKAADWINQDEYDSRFVEGKAGTITAIPWQHIRPFYTAIRRDNHSLRVMQKEKPDIICVGIYHAVKFDFIFGRDGRRSHYFLSEQFVENQLRWEILHKMWKASHGLYQLKPPRQ